ncbi:amidohydrolase family protein [Zoogloea sp.]|uniref:amidohydrolase family protein n=1 Tax=Zoogloea sp. TaxID=49181 RepID=UPI001D391C3D|nr:amidohydrolase family protein [Zoogloea sp.]MBK6655539.1 amidohydrolase family protein [Zoogloea sp.]
MNRRHFIIGATGAAALLGAGGTALARRSLWNPCRASLPPDIAGHEVVRAAWEGLDPARVWDCHAHLAGIGDGGSGVTITPRMLSPLHPTEYFQRLFYLNAGCAHEAPGRVDQSYVERLHNLADGMQTGFKLMLLAFERTHDAHGRPQPELTAFHVPNAYARDVARANPAYFEWVCSIHPYRPDCVEALEGAARDGARAVKWLPPAMGIDPASPACDRFYTAMARLGIPLITHAGEEKAVHGAGQPAWGNPLRLRRALDHGVRVVIAHCASLGEDQDEDRGRSGPRVSSFSLFSRLMGEQRYAGLLSGDISAINLRNRDVAIIRLLLEQEDWHPRLLFGTDYPLPGILPLVSARQLARERLLDPAAVPVLETLREHNPLLFDFVLKRHLRSGQRHFARGVFETRNFFDRKPA